MGYAAVFVRVGLSLFTAAGIASTAPRSYAGTIPTVSKPSSDESVVWGTRVDPSVLSKTGCRNPVCRPANETER